MKLPDAEFNSKAKVLEVGSALMIVSGYYGELFVTGDLTIRWQCWLLSVAQQATETLEVPLFPDLQKSPPHQL